MKYAKWTMFFLLSATAFAAAIYVPKFKNHKIKHVLPFDCYCDQKGKPVDCPDSIECVLKPE